MTKILPDSNAEWDLPQSQSAINKNNAEKILHMALNLQLKWFYSTADMDT